jgi:hypothetical protein
MEDMTKPSINEGARMGWHYSGPMMDRRLLGIRIPPKFLQDIPAFDGRAGVT